MIIWAPIYTENGAVIIRMTLPPNNILLLLCVVNAYQVSTSNRNSIATWAPRNIVYGKIEGGQIHPQIATLGKHFHLSIFTSCDNGSSI
mmetsp:Transcript_31269/g.67031  ORF Transcript_31269/g.67031 Transcript_31269/m.67031 type:complete len:89 (-) Transcript_31269:405-671(-)